MSGIPTDAMSDVLSLVRMSGDLVCLGNYAAPWSISLGRPLAHFHIVLQGSAWLVLEGWPPLHLVQGDLVLLPHSTGHVLASDPAIPAVPVEQSVAASPPGAPLEHRIDGPGGRSKLICGRFSFSGPLVPRLFTVLPPLIHIEGRAGDALDPLYVTTRFLLHEAQNPTPGSAIMINRLLDLLFIQIVRDWGARSPRNLSWLGGLRDQQIGRALSAIHQTPERNWTVAALAAEAGLSRSAFAIRFADIVGQTPLSYVATWRLDRAAAYLRGGSARITEIAALTGYGSEAALSRAFKRQFGVSPAQYRRGG
ncbi:AraC family transcriptional regulator [Tabrizicola sp.]|uniref:AraC family transcriptional regulator n=1 Tax=Tabrizicola sp. TaxID=2005166 RepID=UPI003F401301